MDGAVQQKSSSHKKFTGLTLETMVQTLILKASTGKKGKKMETLLTIALAMFTVVLIGQFGDALYRRLTGRIGL